MTLAWMLLNLQNEQLIREQVMAVASIEKQPVAYGALGPSQDFEQAADQFQHCVDVWFESSLLLNQLCHARQIECFHFLQPNQYVPNSKTMSRAEAELSYSLDSPFAGPAMNYYSLMQEKTNLLADAGVQFTDLTQVFADVEEVIYRDNCCHVNADGSDILARRMVRVIADSLQEQATDGR